MNPHRNPDISPIPRPADELSKPIEALGNIVLKIGELALVRFPMAFKSFRESAETFVKTNDEVKMHRQKRRV